MDASIRRMSSASPFASQRRAARSTRKVRVPRKANAKTPMLPMPSELLEATPNPDVVTVPARTVLSIEGTGAPEGETFQRALHALYGVAFTLKFARKKAGGLDFRIGPLEGRWWAALSGATIVLAPRETWRWCLRLAVPDGATQTEVREAIRVATGRKGGKLEKSVEATTVSLERLPAQRVGRSLHVGPYSEEGRTFDALDRALAKAGVKPAFSHLEVYLSDPRRTAPARLRTVLLRETH